MISVGPCSWDQIRQIWETELWPDRRSELRTHSAMRYLGGYDSDIHTSPVDFICVRDPDIVGVISGFLSKQGLYRCRGIYVRPEHRGQGISRLLFAAAEQQAVARGCLRMWSFPRHEALPSYLAYGFRQTSGWRWSGEWGPNCFVIKAVEKSATTTKNRL